MFTYQQATTDGKRERGWQARFGPMLAGFLAAVVVMFAASSVAPRHTITALSLAVRAVTYCVLVFGAGAATALCVSWFSANKTANAGETAIRTGLAGMWLAALLVAFEQKSWLAVSVWALWAAEAARLLALSEDESQIGPGKLGSPQPPQMFVFPRAQHIPGLVSAVGSFLVQGAVLAAIGSDLRAASLLYFAGTAALMWRAVRMFRDSPPQQDSDPAFRTSVLVGIAVLLIAFLWLPHLRSRGIGFGGGSSTALVPNPSGEVSGGHSPANSAPPDENDEGSGGSPLVLGSVFPGVILYPKVEPRVTLVAPAPAVPGFGSSRSEVSIPFDGVYWFWRPPTDRPPTTSVRKYGSPASLTFRSTDGSPLWMEAHQNLGSVINLDCCAGIDLLIENADSDPRTVTVELVLRNTLLPGKPSQSLGLQEVSVPEEKRSGPEPQTLSFHVPGQARVRSFDELTVRFRLKWWRGDKSANIAIRGFRLVSAR